MKTGKKTSSQHKDITQKYIIYGQI